MEKKILVTGASGFAGRHLVEHLSRKEKDSRIFGTCHNNILESSSSVEYVKLALENYSDTEAVVADIKPDEVYHLAAVSFMPDAVADRLGTYRANVDGGVCLLEALAVHAPACRILYTSSSDAYGKIDPAENPIRETHPLNPENTYSATKVIMEVICSQYSRKPGLDIVIARPFNHTGPGQSEKFVAPAFAMQIARIEAGLSEPVIMTGGLDVQRDFTDVRDVVVAYAELMRLGERGGVYNVCSGRAVGVEWILNTLLGLSIQPEVRHKIAPSRKRSSENKVIYGSNEALRKLTGWRPAIALEKTLADLLEDCRRRAKNQDTG